MRRRRCLFNVLHESQVTQGKFYSRAKLLKYGDETSRLENIADGSEAVLTSVSRWSVGRGHRRFDGIDVDGFDEVMIETGFARLLAI